MNESDLKKQIRDLLHIKGIFHRNIWQGPMSDKGIPDLIGIFKGKPLAIEVKGPRAKIRPEQVEFLNQWVDEGGIGFIAWSIEDVIDRLGLEGVR